MKAKVALIQGEDRYDNIRRALHHIGDGIDLSHARQVLIKPNFVSFEHPLACTHIDALRAVLDFVRRRYTGRVLIAEGAALHRTADAFAYYGLPQLAESYEVELCDLNGDEPVPVRISGKSQQPRTLHLARAVVESDFRISVGPPKTHDTVIVTMSLKNMIMGSLINRTAGRRLPTFARLWGRLQHGPANDKLAMHQGFPLMNLNLALLAPRVWPHLAVIDGYEAMEGAGPVEGTAVPWRVAIASCDPLAADTFTTRLMGFDPAEVGYLAYCGQLGLGVSDPALMEISGNVDPEVVRRSFRPHPAFEQQRQWQSATAKEQLRQSFSFQEAS